RHLSGLPDTNCGVARLDKSAPEQQPLTGVAPFRGLNESRAPACRLADLPIPAFELSAEFGVRHFGERFVRHRAILPDGRPGQEPHALLLRYRTIGVRYPPDRPLHRAQSRRVPPIDPAP